MASPGLAEKRARAAASFRRGLKSARGAWAEFSAREGTQAVAAFSFFSFLSLFALLALAGGILGMVLEGKPELYRRMVEYLAEQVPGLSETIQEALNTSRDLGGVLGLAGFAGLLFTGTKATDSLQLWMAGVWDGEKPPFLRRKFKGLVMLLVIALAAGLGLGIHILLVLAAGKVGFLEVPLLLAAVAVSTGIHFAGLAFVYHYAPEKRLRFRQVWKGALLASLLINPFQLLLTWYYSRLGNLSVVYGSFAAVIIAVTIIFYTAYVVFLGASLNRYLSKGWSEGSSPGMTEKKEEEDSTGFPAGKTQVGR